MYTEDGVDFLYNAINCRMTAVLNPNATAFKNGNNTPGTSPVVSYLEIAERLKEPRKKLTIWMDSSTSPDGNAIGGREDILVSPAVGYDVDCVHGPTCYVHSLDVSHGNSSVWMDLSFSTHIRNCPEPVVDGIPNPIIGLRYTMSVEHDPSNFTAIRTTTGTCHFRQDMLQKYKYTADIFRKYYILPVPLGFRRDPPYIVLHPDGCAVNFVVTDREQLLSFPGGVAFGATECEVYETRAYVNPVLSPGGIIGDIGDGIDDAWKWLKRPFKWW